MKVGAFFDIDGTIVDCQSQEKLVHSFINKGLVPAHKLLSFAFWFYFYKMGWVRGSTEGIRKQAYAIFSRFPSSEVDAVIKSTYAAEIFPRINPFVFERIKWHKERHHCLVAFSGTLVLFCKLICDDVGIDEYYGTKLKSRDGCYTQDWEGSILEGVEKAKALCDLAKCRGIDLSKSYAYADMSSDLFFLEEVGHPVVVCPDSIMKKIATKKRWEIIGRES